MIRKFIILLFLVFLLTSLACSMPGLAPLPTSTPIHSLPAATLPSAAMPSPVPLTTGVDIPTRGSGKAQVVHDQVNLETAAEKRAFGGDDFNHGRLERPFTQDMVYLPWLDIVEANMVWDTPYVYFMLRLAGSPASVAGESPAYGLELDTDLDSRGDFLLLSRGALAGEWLQQGATLWQDANGNVGGYTPVESDPPAGGGDGYEQAVAAGEGLCWTRLDPLVDNRLELAIHRTLLQDVQSLNWRAFADGLFLDGINFDPNDRFTIDEAGSADKNSNFYPLKALYAYDNTCIAPYNYLPLGGEPGLCVILGQESGTSMGSVPPETGIRSADPGGPGVWIPEPGGNPP